jgi:Mn2+/Fe2+ NRAMP family transporter
MTATNTNSKLTRQRYRGLVYGIGGLAILGLLAGIVLDQHFAGTLVYLLGAWIAGGIAVLAPMWSEATLQDERDWELHNRASGILIGITMVLGLSILPALYVLEAGNHLEITGVVSGVILTFSALFLLYGVCFGIAKRRV